ncbi:DUF2721 domain-containing protein [Oculatella sp. LEGE 06141]|uniref:DUF2721 domain-containing protein n=1 Tax=Oculatella sp. LEGE 06141 TaxID=1828648 RepID=UPI00187F03EA|nr:DUF2721 domain-containing protein [Oculatella sp. LEGE 06141]MBE9180697.1 DUF2721 domain-containing protein [Oculatella sp. LEGE 06141]
MSVEQTSQLIQLILNSVLMVTACVMALGSLVMRHAAINDRLKTTHREYSELCSDRDIFRSDRLLQLKSQLRQLRQRYRMAYRSVLALHYALLLFVASTFITTLRATLHQDWLIPGGLILFTAGIGLLLVGLGFALMDVHTSGQPFWMEPHGMIGMGTATTDKTLHDARAASSIYPLPQRVVQPRPIRRKTGTDY